MNGYVTNIERDTLENEDYRRVLFTVKNLQLVLMTQHYDTIKEVGSSSKVNTIFIPYSPGGMADLSAQMRDALIGANAAASGADEAGRTP